MEGAEDEATGQVVEVFVCHTKRAGHFPSFNIIFISMHWQERRLPAYVVLNAADSSSALAINFTSYCISSRSLTGFCICLLVNGPWKRADKYRKALHPFSGNKFEDISFERFWWCKKCTVLCNAKKPAPQSNRRPTGRSVSHHYPEWFVCKS